MKVSECALVLHNTLPKLERENDVPNNIFQRRLNETDFAAAVLFKDFTLLENGNTPFFQLIMSAAQKIDDLESVVALVSASGALHNKAGVTASHYESVACACLYAIQQVFGPNVFNAEIADAWSWLLVFVVNVMKAAPSRVDGVPITINQSVNDPYAMLMPTSQPQNSKRPSQEGEGFTLAERPSSVWRGTLKSRNTLSPLQANF